MPSRATALACVALALGFGAGGIARAQAPDPDDPPTADDVQNLPQSHHDVAGQDLGTGFPVGVPDNEGVCFVACTPSTPYAKEMSAARPQDRWTQVAGALFPVKQVDDPKHLVEASPTSYSDNLFDVAFAHTDLGLAGGARCESSAPDEEAGCRPIVYKLTFDEQNGASWEEEELPGGSEPGFIAAIAWVDNNNAVAVGGTGTFPRREPPWGEDIDGNPCEESRRGEPYGVHCDQAGSARAWLYSFGAWCEMGRDAACPDLPRGRDGTQARGLTAIDFRSYADETVLGFAGALGQIFRFDGHPAAGGLWSGDPPVYDNDSPRSELDQGQTSGSRNHLKLFNFRVRDIEIAPYGRPRAFAVTSGCCGPHNTSDYPLILTYTDYDGTHTISPRWYLGGANDFLFESPNADPDQDLEYATSWVDTAYDFNPTFGIVPGMSLKELGAPFPPPTGRLAATKTSTTQSGLDSVYSVMAGTDNCVICPPAFSILRTAAATNLVVEPRSEIACGFSSSHTRNQPGRGAVVTPALSTGRLVAMDGAVDSPNCTGPLPDWTVGELRSQHVAPDGRRGLVVAARIPERSRARGNPCPAVTTPTIEKPVPEPFPCGVSQRTAAGAWDETWSGFESLSFVTSSYTLNAVEMVGDTGQGWAVGDHGAILRLGGPEQATGQAAGRQAGEPDPARVGTRRTQHLSGRNALGEAPVGAGSVLVPPLATRPLQKLAEPRLVNTGSPDATHTPETEMETEDVAEIVMSRDGSEGWAVGPNPPNNLYSGAYGTMSLYHFTNGSWLRCDPFGAPGQLESDRACASLRRLKRFQLGGSARTVKLVSAARVPFENDTNPTNDDRFEVVAIGTVYGGDPRHGQASETYDDDVVVLRYRDGEWGFEDPEARRAIRPPQSQGSEPPNDQFFYLRDVAFTAPDDGWILGCSACNGSNPGTVSLYHYNGEHWERCPVGTAASLESGCGSSRIPAQMSGGSLGSNTPRLLPAGDRVYIYGERILASPPNLQQQVEPKAPYILYHERDGEWTDGHGPGEDGGGFDPAWQSPAPDVQGRIYSLAVTQNYDGTYSGWAQGRFFNRNAPPDIGDDPDTGGAAVTPPDALMMRLVPGARHWEQFHDPGALADYTTPQVLFTNIQVRHRSEPHLHVVLPGSDGTDQSFLAQRDSGRLYGFNSDLQRWDLVRSNRPPTWTRQEEAVHGVYQAIAPDGQGGFWAAVKNAAHHAPAEGETWKRCCQVFFYHYTATPPEEVFTETPHPFSSHGLRMTSLAGAPDGSLWAASDSSLLARYDRIGGWETVRIPGWDAGRTLGQGTRVNAVAVGPDGAGVAVGPGGRIAELSTDRVALDGAAGVVCEQPGTACGTGYDLNHAAVAPDGSAIVAGDARTLLWRPPGGDFQRLSPLPSGPKTEITDVSMPTAERAFLATNTGFVYAGRMEALGEWTWKIENRITSGPFAGTVLGAISREINIPLRSIAIDADGHGYAIGDRGLVLKRTGDGGQPWRRLRGPGTDDLTSVTLAQEGGGALIGGKNGVVWTVVNEQIDVARPADYLLYYDGIPANDHFLTGPVREMTLAPGVANGQAEAWVAVEGRGAGTDRLLHYSSDPSEPLLNPGTRGIAALPDSSPERKDELSFLAFGKTECAIRAASPPGSSSTRAQASALSRAGYCPAMVGSNETSEMIAERVVAEAVGRAQSPDLALFTGDATDSAGFIGTGPAHLDRTGDPTGLAGAADLAGLSFQPKTFGVRKHRRFTDFVADPLTESGITMLGALGPGDLSRPYYDCRLGGSCASTPEEAKTGDNLAWREAFATRPAPWGFGDDPEPARVGLQQASGADDSAIKVPDVEVDADGDDNLVRPVEVKGGARTHYAADVIRNGEVVARVVVVDSSLRGLANGDPAQQPVETNGGQLEWLERMLCFRGQQAPSGAECTREPDQEAIVVSNTPTYTYAPLNPAEIAPDAAVLESLYLRYRVSVVVSGRLGWNGLYYALAPGLHTPCPGGSHPRHAPEPGLPLCDSVASRLPVSDPTGQTDPDTSLRSVEDAAGAKLPSLSEVANIDGIVPFVVAASAGAKTGPSGEADGSAAQGFWHGYTLVRVAPDGDPRKLIVEQRPILDWISLEAARHTLSAREELTLKGSGREPISFSTVSQAMTTRFDEISNAAITHRYDLLLADPAKPWLPCLTSDGRCGELHSKLAGSSAHPDAEEGRCAPYLCLPERIATADSQSGEVKAGDGRYPDTLAIAMLSVGEHVATYPLLFEKSPSFVVEPVNLATPIPAPPNVASNPPQPPQPPNPPQPNVPQVQIATPPPVPPIAPLQAAQPPEPQPPAPPAPPPPAEQFSPLSLSLAPPSLGIATPTAVIQPPTPPVNPAPPGGARREARQRQAAAQKSGADSDQEDSNVDKADAPLSPTSAAYTRNEPAEARRRDRARPESSFTPLARADQPSAWAQGALYTGGMALVAFALAAGFSRGGPTPRRRTPEVPATAMATARVRSRQ